MKDEELVEAFRVAVYGERWRDEGAVMDSGHTLKGIRAALAAAAADEKYPGEFNALRARIEKLEAELKAAREPSKRPFDDNTDAPTWLAWQCPDCESWATLGANAGHHMRTAGHGAPVLATTVFEAVLSNSAEELAEARKTVAEAEVEEAALLARIAALTAENEALRHDAKVWERADTELRECLATYKLAVEAKDAALAMAKQLVKKSCGVHDDCAAADIEAGKHMVAIGALSTPTGIRAVHVTSAELRTIVLAEAAEQVRQLHEGMESVRLALRLPSDTPLHSILESILRLWAFWDTEGEPECCAAHSPDGKHLPTDDEAWTREQLEATRGASPLDPGWQDARVTSDVEAGREPLSDPKYVKKVAFDAAPQKPHDANLYEDRYDDLYTLPAQRKRDRETLAKVVEPVLRKKLAGYLANGADEATCRTYLKADAHEEGAVLRSLTLEHPKGGWAMCIIWKTAEVAARRRGV